LFPKLRFRCDRCLIADLGSDIVPAEFGRNAPDDWSRLVIVIAEPPVMGR
jgi:hypothetical protein